jgi:hypothetical protein
MGYEQPLPIFDYNNRREQYVQCIVVECESDQREEYLLNIRRLVRVLHIYSLNLKSKGDD